jgi:protein-disulfide isomerase
MTRWVLAVSMVVSGAWSVAAQTPACDELTGARRQLAEQLLTTEYLYDCCDDTVAACLERDPTCALAVRLADTICRRVADGQNEGDIRRSLSRRARSMVGGGAPAEIDLTSAPVIGSDDASVTVVIYACARCPYCSKLIPELYREVTRPPLNADVRLAFRIFPIRGHPGSTPAGLGFAAAAEMGAFWPFMLHAYARFDDFSPELQPGWARAVGLDAAAFETRMADPTTRESLVASKKEGLVNGVEATPTLFINGRMWVGDLTTDELLDAIEEEAARVKGERWLTD